MKKKKVCMDVKRKVLAERFDLKYDAESEIANSLITISLLHERPLSNKEVFTITLHLKNDFEKYLFVECGWNRNFSYDT